MIPDSLLKLIESFKCLPGIGEKTAERLAFSIFDMEEEQVNLFSDSLKDVIGKVHKCSKCNSLTEDDICSICKDKTRSNESLFVVDDVKNVFLFEKLGMFHGKYHVIDGLINPLEGINPEDIGLEKLVDRISKGGFKEIIFGLKPSIEGETTSLYISKLLEKYDVVVSRIALGIPMGADIDYVDSLTLEMALENRKIISSN